MERIHVHYYPERRVNEEDRVHASSTSLSLFLTLILHCHFTKLFWCFSPFQPPEFFPSKQI